MKKIIFIFSSDFRIANSLSSKVKKNYILKDEEILILDSNSSFKNLDSNLIKKKSNIKKIVPKKSKYYTKLEILRQGNFDKMFNLKNFKFIKEVRKNIKDMIFLGEGSCYNVCLNLQEKLNFTFKKKHFVLRRLMRIF